MTSNTKSVLKIYDTATKTIRTFTPISNSQVKMYCCGPTVYDYLHIGNFRGAVFFNFVRNWLETQGYSVKYIYNFTDIDDKILQRSIQKNVSPQELSTKYIQEFKKDYQSLKLKAHTANPRATETLKTIIDLISTLIKQGAAYEIEGDVFYSVLAFKKYGQLSGRNLTDILSGQRIKTDKRKKHPGDFALWKKTKAKENWHFESPWGQGRPGWHIECTAMIHKFLGDSIDIHAGGSDLIFPHHENEIAQSETCTHKKYVQFWMHNQMIEIEGDKMSKSIGNILTMRSFLNQYPGELFKFLIFSVHYRSTLKFSKKTIQQALASLLKIYSTFVKAQDLQAQNQNILTSAHSMVLKTKTSLEFYNLITTQDAYITKAINDDFATPKVCSLLFIILNAFQKLLGDLNVPNLEKSYCAYIYLACFKKYGKIFSLFQEDPTCFLQDLENKFLEHKQLTRKDIEDLIKQRDLFRKNKDFKKSDQIRDKLNSLGILLKDHTENSQWILKI